MLHRTAEQIAALLNKQNQLAISYTPEMILEHQDRYLVRMDVRMDNSLVLGVVAVTKVQWYQCEISHLSVGSNVRRHGIAKGLLRDAEAKALQHGAKIAQCTIRGGNEASEELFRGQGYTLTARFFNSESGNQVAVYQKVL